MFDVPFERKVATFRDAFYLRKRHLKEAMKAQEFYETTFATLRAHEADEMEVVAKLLKDTENK